MIGQTVQIGERLRVDRFGFMERDRGALGPADHAPGMMQSGGGG